MEIKESWVEFITSHSSCVVEDFTIYHANSDQGSTHDQLIPEDSEDMWIWVEMSFQGLSFEMKSHMCHGQAKSLVFVGDIGYPSHLQMNRNPYFMGPYKPLLFLG